jgi:hypothetical protein
MIRFVIIVQLKAQCADGCVVGEQRLLRHDPHVARIRHIVHGRVPKYYKGIVLAARRQTDRERERKMKMCLATNTFHNGKPSRAQQPRA